MESSTISSRVAAWVKSPYNDNMGIGGWFAFLGMLAVLTFLWTRILRAIAINA